jgi:2,4-dienoyl-CoA reductase (NADPH2)
MHTGLEDKAADYQKLAAYFSARAKGGVGLMVTGGMSPNRLGRLTPFASKLSSPREVARHRLLTEVAHQHDSKIVMQILHAGRYAYHPFAVAPSAIKSPISPFKPWKMSRRRVISTIADFANSAALAQQAGYDGVEVMGSEGYLISQFLSAKTNTRTDEWGGDFAKRMRIAVEIVKAIRAKVGAAFIIIFRLSLLDLVPYGSSWDEIVLLATALQDAGVTLLNTGIGWHEARVPTIVTSVPRAAFVEVTHKLKQLIKTPIIATNRINTPEGVECILAAGQADCVSMARPLLADAEFVNKAYAQKAKLINTCIACNQACLDHVFSGKRASCLVNPQACHETELTFLPTDSPKQLAVVGAGPAGCAFAIYAASRGHRVTLYDSKSELGGQFNYAKRIPGKEEFHETLRYFQERLVALNVTVTLNHRVSADELLSKNYDEVVLATGVSPRRLNLPGVEHSKVVDYLDVLQGKIKVGKNVVIIGAGGIGFDVATFLLEKPNQTANEFFKQWHVDISMQSRGGLQQQTGAHVPAHHITMCQRKAGKMGQGLGKTTGWIHRMVLKKNNVRQLTDVSYVKIDDEGLHVCHQEKNSVLSADHIIVCAGQEPLDELYQPLQAAGCTVHKIGGADVAAELDAKRAISQAAHLASII